MRNVTLATWLTGATLLAAVAQPAVAITIADNYVGAAPTNAGYVGDDVIGADGTYDILSADISVTGTTLTVTINTNYAGKTGADSTFYGDLFLSSSWSPVGSATYDTDQATNGTNWTYGLALDDRTVAGGSSFELYELTGTNVEDAILSDEAYTSGGIYRSGQEVYVDTGSTTTTATGKTGTMVANDTADTIEFTIDLAGTSVLDAGSLAIHWAMSCANDVIEGFVPAPIILLLMSTGLLGVGVSTAVRRKRA